jgi:hypothetical protein
MLPQVVGTLKCNRTLCVEKTENQQNKNNEILLLFCRECVAKSLQMVAWLRDAGCQSLIIIVFSDFGQGAAGPRDKKPAVIGWLVVLTKVARKRVYFASVST